MIETALQRQQRILAETKERALRAADYAAKMDVTLITKPVSNTTKAVSNTERQRKWRLANPERKRQQDREAQQRRRKAARHQSSGNHPDAV